MRVGRLLVLMLVLMATLTHAVRVLGAAGESPVRVRMLLPEPGCGTPCWQGIHPRQTDPEQATAVFQRLPDSKEIGDGLWTYAPEDGYQNMVGYLDMLTLTADRVRIGEVMVHIGAPAFLTRQIAIRIATGETQELLRLFYPDQHMILVAAVAPGGRLSPHSPIAAINFVAPRPLRAPDAATWRGFTWLDRHTWRFAP